MCSMLDVSVAFTVINAGLLICPWHCSNRSGPSCCWPKCKIAHLAWFASLVHECSILTTSAPSLVQFFSAERIPLSPVYRTWKVKRCPNSSQLLLFSQWSTADVAEDARVSPPKQRQLCEELDNKELEDLYADMEVEDPFVLTASRALCVFSLWVRTRSSSWLLRQCSPICACVCCCPGRLPWGDGVDALVQCQICNQVELPVKGSLPRQEVSECTGCVDIMLRDNM